MRALQRLAGNAAVTRLLQRTVTRPDNPPDATRPWYSDVTGSWYESQGHALHEERMEENRFRLRREGGGLGYDPDAADEDWDPQAMFQQRMQNAATGNRDLVPLEQTIANWDNTSQRLATPFGPVGFQRGWGQAPFVRSNMADFGNARVGFDYDDLCRILDNREAREIERLAGDILAAARGNGAIDATVYDDETRRAAAHLLTFTHIAEESVRRTPGSADLARQGLLAISDGTRTFTDVFNRANGSFIPAAVGGTQQMRNAAQGLGQVDDLLGGMMEDSDHGESDEERF